MKFCHTHWDQLRKAIDDRGLTPFIAKDGKVAVAQLTKQIETGDDTKATFDPLMSAHWSITTNAMQALDRVGINPLYLLSDGSEAPDGRNDCPLCELNYLHEQGCTNPDCTLDKKRGYDWMIDRAASDALSQAREYGLVP